VLNKFYSLENEIKEIDKEDNEIVFIRLTEKLKMMQKLVYKKQNLTKNE
jgi:hypothetical protein